MKPPIGIKPIYILRGDRIVEICQAIILYASEGKSIPKKWRKELNKLINKEKS